MLTSDPKVKTKLSLLLLATIDDHRQISACQFSHSNFESTNGLWHGHSYLTAYSYGARHNNSIRRHIIATGDGASNVRCV